MRKVLSLIIVAVFVIAMAAVAAGCKSSSGSESNGDSGKYGKDIPGGVGDVSAETLEALSQSGTVTVYDFGSSKKETVDDAKFEDYFEDVYGGTIDKMSIEWEGWESKFITAFAANDAPDVIYLYSKLWPRAASRGFVYSKADLEKLGVKALDHPVITNSAELAANNFTYAKNVYALDVYLVTPNVMLVNDTLLKDCGVTTTPKQFYEQGKWNWDSFTSICKQVASIDGNNDGAPDYRAYNGWDMTYVVNANGGQMIAMDEAGKVKTNFDDIAVTNGLQMIKDMYINKFVVEAGEFSAGKTATFVETHYNVAKKISNSGKGLNFDWSVVPMPLGADNKSGTTPGGCEAYAIVSSTENPQGSLNYIIAKSAFKSQYEVEDPDYDLEYWLDDEGDQMLVDLRLKVHESTFAGVGSIWNQQWDFWTAVRSNKQTVSELLNTWSKFFDAQCEIENAY